MKLILTAAVDKLGIPGDIVEVRDGYGRNYLLPQGMAIAWSKGAEKQIEGIKRARDARQVRDVAHAEELRTQLEGLTISIPKRSSESGQLYGSVTASEFAQAARKAGGPALDRRSVSFNKPVRTVGNHIAAVKLHDAVTAHVTFSVEAEK